MTENEAIELLKGMQSPLEDYAELVGAPAFAYGHKYAYPDPQDYAIEEAIEALKEIQQYREIGTVEEFRKTADRNNQKQPVWKNGRSTIFKDYADGHGEAEENKWADWVCPECGWFVGEQYLPRQHNQSKCNFCPKCGQAIRWEN